MDSWSTETSDEDITLKMLESVFDGSVASLATYHLLEMQLRNIRSLPELGDGKRTPSPG